MQRTRRGAIPLFLAALLIMSVVGSAAFTVMDAEECAPCGDWESYPLYAGQDWLVGEVLVNNCEDKVCVQYVLDDEVVADDFGITEVHLAIGSDFSDIPQTKKGNPIPGQFEVNESFDSGVPNTSVYCFEYEGAPGEELIIAAHAVVARDAQTHTVPHELCVFSGVDTEMEGETELVAAAHTWVHPNWNPSLTEALDERAEWIWSSDYVEDPRNGGLVDFFDEFEVVGTPTGATLKIAADNAFAFSVNGNPIAEVNLAGDWRNTSTFGLAYVPDPSPAAWSIVHTYTYELDDYIGMGFNELAVTAVNAAYNTDSPTVNPGGVRYELCITSEEEVVGREAASETAWGGTVRMVSKGNWATYITYPIQDCVPVCDEWIVYGSNLGTTANPLGFADTSADAIFAIDLKNQSVSVAYDPGLLRTGQNYPNGNAYDPVNQWLFFATDQGNLYFYDMVEDAQYGPFSVGGNIASGAWYDGAYYYVAQNSANLYKVDVDKNGASRTQVGTLGRALSYGDIVFDIDRPGVLFGSGGGDNGYYFTYDLSTNTYEQLRSGVPHKQLAYASNGVLYGVTALTGNWYEIDPVTGDDELFWENSTWNGQTIQLTDLADGPMCD